MLGDDLLALADLLSDKDVDWCSRCSGYAIRRLNDVRLARYRAVRRLHAIAPQSDPGCGGYAPGRLGPLVEDLQEPEKRDPNGEDRSWSFADENLLASYSPSRAQ
ncbi:hypothetical protein [Streptomyces sp. NPDC003863]